MSRLLTVVGWSLRLGLSDLRTVHTWRSWVFGWLSRVVSQVLFFSLVGLLFGGRDQVQFLLVGSAAVIAVLECLSIVMWAAADRHLGTAGLVVVSPTDYFLAFAARGLHTVLTGTLSALIALYAGAAILRVPLHWQGAVAAAPVVLLGACSVYLLAVLVAGLVATASGAQWLALNLTYMLIMIFGGFVIPLDTWPAVVRAIVSAVPYTHALQALREALATGPDWSSVLAHCGWEVVVAAAWAVAAKSAFGLAIRHERRSGGALLAG
ncbi:ABC transporter permease [Plantactinospora endophytica]|uniref:ABC-2 type transporter transmembrane domain-containing protein n=1 Tax=Plantactinospora endophytica TaxID=673535 RepID=A0ABQ4EEL5_9ACTN|nr:ABC transporter permease [Plantactinospora endophytica]GIG93134.1 hypothetical protein Pen02_80700 [Plantactinospora endophytica]